MRGLVACALSPLAVLERFYPFFITQTRVFEQPNFHQQQLPFIFVRHGPWKQNQARAHTSSPFL